MIKVRFITWYWGNYCLASEDEAANLPMGFELYDEQKHGFHNSEEYAKGIRQWKADDQVEDLFRFEVNSTYVRRVIEKLQNGTWRF